MNEEREKEELKKLKLETLKLEKEIKVLQRRPILHPSAYIPLLVSIIGLLGAGIKLTTTTSERNEARNEAQAAQTGLASVIAQSSPGQLQIVNIKFRGSLTRDLIIGLQEKFNSSGIVSPRASRTDDIDASSIVYYYATDGELAKRVAKQVSDYFLSRGCPLTITPVLKTDQASRVSSGTIELAIYQSCN